MFRGSDLLLLLLCTLHESGASPVHVTGEKGGSVTLQCDIEAEEIFEIILSSLSKNIPVCENEECESDNDRVFKEGSCDVVIKDLRFSDAGKNILRVYYNDDQTKLVQGITEYHLHIHDEISVQEGEDLELDVLLINADKVERSSSSGWTELWTRGHGVSSDRLTDRDETLIIHEFKVNDTGTYRVLDYEGETLITVAVTESILDSKGNLSDTDEDDTEHRNYWMLLVGLTLVLLVLLVLVLVVLTAVVIHRRLHRDYLKGKALSSGPGIQYIICYSDASKSEFSAETDTENVGCSWPETEIEAENGFF
ncbi:hypothetical protein R3I93_016663 [Phoxinus phoxinus]|uniref:Uncharacterized protein n=1 Tax=Phoxinus phoxinus TaxID=58324 RepID=A0AAN9CPM2_9TELE